MIKSFLRDRRVCREEIGEDFFFEEQYDLVVGGLGSSGSIAAIRAAGLGLSVLGLERLNNAGGQHISGAVFSYYRGSPGGFYGDLDRRAAELSDSYARVDAYSPEVKKYLLEQDLLEAGGTIRYGAMVTSVYLGEENRVAGLEYFYQGRFHQVSAKIVVDATADGTICAALGASYTFGRKMDGAAQPFSNVLIQCDPEGRMRGAYADNGRCDARDAEAISEALVKSGASPLHLREKYDGEPYLIGNGALLGLREGRLIQGEGCLSLEEALGLKPGTTEPLFYGQSNLDNHGKDTAFESELYQDFIVAANLWGLSLALPVCKEYLVPREFDGLLLSGRLLSRDHDVAVHLRMNRDMQKSGEAAAILAYQAIRKNIRPRELEYEDLIPLLREYGLLDESNNVNMLLYGNRDPRNRPFSWLKTFPEIKEGLASDQAGIAVWSAVLMGKEAVPELKKWLVSGDERLGMYTALSLALLGDEGGLPLLRRAAETRDSRYSGTGFEYNYPLGLSSVYLLGRLGDRGSIEILKNIIESPGYPFEISTENKIFVASRQECYFHYCVHCLMALIRIARKHPELKAGIESFICCTTADPSFHLVLKLKSSNADHDMTGEIRGRVLSALGPLASNKN